MQLRVASSLELGADRAHVVGVLFRPANATAHGVQAHFATLEQLLVAQ